MSATLSRTKRDPSGERGRDRRGETRTLFWAPVVCRIEVPAGYVCPGPAGVTSPRRARYLTRGVVS